jgi:hypothetical protein
MSYQGAGIQINPEGGRGRGGRGGRGRGRGFQGRGRTFVNQYQGNISYNGNQNQNFNYQPRNFIPPIPQPFYNYLVNNFESKVDGEDKLKYPVLNMHRPYLIKKFKLNSIITKELLERINPKEDESNMYHFKKTYCSPNGIMNDGLFFELQQFINDISS